MRVNSQVPTHLSSEVCNTHLYMSKPTYDKFQERFQWFYWKNQHNVNESANPQLQNVTRDI